MTKGESITACFDYLSRCAAEITNFAECAKDLFRKELQSQGKSLGFTVGGEWVEDWRNDEADWLVSDYAWSLPLKKLAKGNQSAKSFFGLQVSLAGDGLSPRCAEPVVHVCCTDEKFSFDDDCYIGFPIEPGYRDGEDKLVIEHNRCVFWSRNEVEPWRHDWHYTVRLTAFSGPGDVKKLVVDPAIKLLRGVDVRDALPDQFLGSGLIEYPELERLFEPRG